MGWFTKHFDKSERIEEGFMELVDFEKIIGVWVSKNSGQRLETSMGIIQYTLDGRAHIIPAYPGIEHDALLKNPEEITEGGKIRLKINEALLGKIPPFLIMITGDVDVEQKRISLSFFYEKNIQFALTQKLEGDVAKTLIEKVPPGYIVEKSTCSVIDKNNLRGENYGFYRRCI